jgi:hypothetical protein
MALKTGDEYVESIKSLNLTAGIGATRRWPVSFEGLRPG